jgi:hypothetical protein
MLLTSFLALSVVGTACDFEGGFSKARSDVANGSYGYNLDQFCFAEPSESKSDYKKGYDSGRAHGAKLNAVGILQNPKDEASVEELLRLAEKKEIEAKQRTEIEELRLQIQKQNILINPQP